MVQIQPITTILLLALCQVTRCLRLLRDRMLKTGLVKKVAIIIIIIIKKQTVTQEVHPHQTKLVILMKTTPITYLHQYPQEAAITTEVALLHLKKRNEVKPRKILLPQTQTEMELQLKLLIRATIVMGHTIKRLTQVAQPLHPHHRD